MPYHSLSDVIRCYPWVQFLLTLPQFFRKTSVASLLIPNPKALCWSTCPYRLELQRCTWSFWRRKLKTSSSICCLATATPTLNPTCHQISNMAGKSMEIPYLYLFIPILNWHLHQKIMKIIDHWGCSMVIFDYQIRGASWAAGAEDSPPDEAHGQQHPGLFEAPRCWCLGAVSRERPAILVWTSRIVKVLFACTLIYLTVYYLYLILIY